MASRTTVCPSCQEAVPSGRLSCPSCGLLLASVAGAPPRRRTRKPTGPEPVAIPPAPVPAGAYVPPAASSGPLLLPARAWAGITSASPRPMAGLGLSARPMATAGGSASMSSGSAGILVKVPTRAPAPPAPRSAGTAAQPAVAATSAAVAVSNAAVTAPDDADDVVEAGWLEAAAGWLMIIGSAVAILGFLLPWSRSVIGAEGVGSYFDTWGIANPSHVLVVLALAAALGLAIVANPIPTWIRTCAVGLALGGLLVGLTWPYLFGPLGAGPGVLAILVGGIMLAVAGILDLVEARHAPAESLV
jgi:hypothetical protein